MGLSPDSCPIRQTATILILAATCIIITHTVDASLSHNTRPQLAQQVDNNPNYISAQTNQLSVGRFLRRTRRTSQQATANQMNHQLVSQFHGSNRKRPANERLGTAVKPKQFRSLRSEPLTGSSSSNNDTRILPSDHNNNSNSNNTATDVNNNSDSDNFVNLDLNSRNQPPRNISSVDGQIDLSQYASDDVDRLYNDALLVYMKNFNDTLPVRRQTFQLGNATMTGQVPTYSTSYRVARHTGWQ